MEGMLRESRNKAKLIYEEHMKEEEVNYLSQQVVILSTHQVSKKV